MFRGCIAMALVMSVSMHGRADVPTANRLAGEAVTAANAGDFKTAAAKYREAYAADPRIELLCNVGVAYFKAKTEAPRAHLFLGRCIEMGARLDPKFIDTVREVLKAVEATLRAGNFTPIDLVVKPPGTLVAVDSWSADETFLARGIWLPFGKHRLTLAAEGHVTQTIELELSTKAAKVVDVTLVRKPVEVPPPAGSGAGSGFDAGAGSGSATELVPPPPPPPPPPPKRRATSSPSLLPAVAVSGVTLGMIVASVWSRSVAHDYAADAGFAVRQSVYDDDSGSVTTYNVLMIATGSLAVVGATIGGYLWYRALRAPASTQVEIDATAGGVSLGIRGRF